MPENTDRRIRKTKGAIKASLKSLLNTQKLEDITVQKLTEDADITRKSFYNHYNNLFDVLDEIENDYLDAFFDKTSDFSLFMQTPKQFLIKTVSHMDSTRDDFMLIARNSDVMRFLHKFISRIKDSIGQSYRLIYDISEFELDNLLTFIAAGMMVVFYNWTNESENHSLKQLQDFFDNVFTLDFWRHSMLYDSREEKML